MYGKSLPPPPLREKGQPCSSESAIAHEYESILRDVWEQTYDLGLFDVKIVAEAPGHVQSGKVREVHLHAIQENAGRSVDGGLSSDDVLDIVVCDDDVPPSR